MGWQTRWRGRAYYVVFDSAFGDGRSFQALLAAWRADPQRPARLHVIALAADALPGFRRMPAPADGVTLDLLTASLDGALTQLVARLDAILLHGVATGGSRFAHALGKLANPGAQLWGTDLGAAQMAALAHAGFAWQGHSEHAAQHALYTSRRPQAALPAARERRAIVLGAGLAGSAASERLCARGWQVTLVERHAQAASEASGNLAGICMPLLSKDDNLMTRLARAAFRYSLDYWEHLGGVGAQGRIAGAQCGVLQLARDAGHAEVQRAIAQSASYPPAFARWLEAAQASAYLGAPAPHGAWLFGQGGWVRPSSACAAMLAACGARLAPRFGVGSVSVARTGADWCVRGADGALLAAAPVLVLANGSGASALEVAAHLPLTAVRGQVTHVAAGMAPDLPFVLCREAYLTPAIDGLHSLGASYDSDDDATLRAASQHDNLEKIRALFGDPNIGRGAPLLGRVGFRSVAPDRLPLVGALPDAKAAGRIERLRDVPRLDGLYGLLGYASRGLAWAPLAAELLAAQLDGEALPLEAELVAALDPARFLLRERRRPRVAPPDIV